MRHLIDARALAAFLCLIPAVAGAQWPVNGVGVTTAATTPVTHVVCGDGAGGIIVAWSEVRNGSSDILARRIPASGISSWSGGGVIVCGAVFEQTTPSICADGAGGAVVTWRDQRNTGFDIYAQRIGPDGAALWTPDGVAVCTVPNNQYGPVAVGDGGGGAVIAWYDFRTMNYDIYAQRVDAAGATLWQTGGVALCTAQASQYNPAIITDGAGGAIVTWTDLRGGNSDVYARKIDTSGTPQWTGNGVAVCAEAHDQLDAVTVSDTAGGVIVAWRDSRAGDWDVYAQRVNTSGSAQWTANGVAVCAATLDQLHPALACDGAGGAVIAWDDARNASTDIYAQRLNASGAVQWAANGVAVCNAPFVQSLPSIVCDGISSTILVWEDRRSGNADIYAQRLNAPGAAQWAANGVTMCNAGGDQTVPLSAPDNTGGVLMVWKDLRSGNLDLYAFHAGASGGTPTGAGTPGLARALTVSPGYPNPFSGGVRFDVETSGERVLLEVFDVTGQRVARRETRGDAVWFDGRDDGGRPLPGGVYLCRFSSGNETRAHKIVIAR